MKFELAIAEADGSMLESMPSTAPQPHHQLELEILAENALVEQRRAG
jgi:hypothetical protein